jgi:hypothetical protein
MQKLQLGSPIRPELASALVIVPTLEPYLDTEQLGTLAAKNRLPTIGGFRERAHPRHHGSRAAANATRDGKSYDRTIAQIGSKRPFWTLVQLRRYRTALI